MGLSNLQNFCGLVSVLGTPFISLMKERLQLCVGGLPIDFSKSKLCGSAAIEYPLVQFSPKTKKRGKGGKGRWKKRKKREIVTQEGIYRSNLPQEFDLLKSIVNPANGTTSIVLS